MWTEDSIFQDNYKNVNEFDYVPWEEIKNKTFFVTGATGLIGTTFIKSLLHANEQRNLNIKIVALVRNLDKANIRFADFIGNTALKIEVGSVEKLPFIEDKIDYIIHGASQTSGKEMVVHAVETIDTAVLGTKNLLELALSKSVEGFIYLSSMEMYGYPKKGHKVKEQEAGALSPLDLRNSYPISKLLCEALCCAYASEYSVPAKIIRLTQTIGADNNIGDNRIFSYFAACVDKREDIVLKTKGETERSYLLATDAVGAILMILLRGKDGQAYNAADETTYCSIAEMAEKVAKDGGVRVEYNIEDFGKNGYPKPIYMDMDTSLLRKLGWKPSSKSFDYKHGDRVDNNGYV